jgi:hypothetical protein
MWFAVSASVPLVVIDTILLPGTFKKARNPGKCLNYPALHQPRTEKITESRNSMLTDSPANLVTTCPAGRS